MDYKRTPKAIDMLVSWQRLRAMDMTNVMKPGIQFRMRMLDHAAIIQIGLPGQPHLHDNDENININNMVAMVTMVADRKQMDLVKGATQTFYDKQ